MFQTTNHFLARKVAKSNWAASLFPDVSSLPPELATNAVGQYVQQKLCKMIVIHFACVWWYQRASKMAKGAKWTWEQRNRGSHLPLKSCFWPHRPFSHELKLKKIKETSFFKLIPHIWWLNYQHFGHVGVKSLFWNFYVVQHAKCYQNSKVHDWSATWAYNQTPPTCSRWHSRWPLGDRNGLAGAGRTGRTWGWFHADLPTNPWIFGGYETFKIGNTWELDTKGELFICWFHQQNLRVKTSKDKRMKTWIYPENYGKSEKWRIKTMMTPPIKIESSLNRTVQLNLARGPMSGETSLKMAIFQVAGRPREDQWPEITAWWFLDSLYKSWIIQCQ